uniref:Uncharacterized protein n=1 Tax=Aegilops tauschii subsp. strangulata TaxID=200361 RepID=A0A453GZX5_AEGTS
MFRSSWFRYLMVCRQLIVLNCALLSIRLPSLICNRHCWTTISIGIQLMLISCKNPVLLAIFNG